MADILFLIGIILLIVPTFLLNIYVGCYLIGMILIIITIVASGREQDEE